MQLQFAILADAAQVLPGGKFVIMGGGVQVLNAPSFPAMNPALALIVRLSVNSEEVEQQHMLRLELLSPDGTNLFSEIEDKPIAAQRQQTPAVDIPPAYTVVINLPALVFPTEGKYQLRLFVDGQELGNAVPLYLQLQPSVQEIEGAEA